MALCILEELLDGYLKSLFDERVVNEKFSEIQRSKSTKGTEFVVQLISKYFVDIEALSSELQRISQLHEVDFSKLAQLSQKVKDLSSSVGAEQVRLACTDLIQACNQMSKCKFSRALILMRNEYGRTHNKLESYIRMERRMMRLQNKKQT